MRLKILTVDDSKAVRMLVRKAFKTYECEILEAANGVEGLALASKESPDIILLDITMPVMDGLEMLTKARADRNIHGIPVIMLTAEAGRETVLKIAKQGIRDYIVKPFSEEVLIDKVGRVIDLRPVGDVSNKTKSLSDPCDILVVEDKPNILRQIADGMADTPWTIHDVASSGEAIDSCQQLNPDVCIISLSLPDDAAFALARALRSNVKTKYLPLLGLAVKTAVDEQQRAQQLGFCDVVTKPIDVAELRAKVCKAINLDTSGRYFGEDEDFFVITLPEGASPAVMNELADYLKPKISEAVDNGFTKVIFDVAGLKNVDMNAIKLLLQAMHICQDLTLTYSLVGNGRVVAECKGFEESKNWTFFESIEDAKLEDVSAVA